MTTKFFSRVELRRDAPAAAIRAVLMPEGQAARAATAHHLVWTLFADAPERARDFLWREHAPGVFYLLSDRAPHDVHGLFDVKEPKVFAPILRPGDRLAFELRVNATISRGGAPGVRGKPCDIVMDALHRLPAGRRAGAKTDVCNRVAPEWLSRQGQRAGFGIERIDVLGYSTIGLDRGRDRVDAKLGVLDLRGILAVHDAGLFVAAIGAGFGRGKAFGCGLMVVRRAWAT